jgi:dephospho-CoA kinase
VIDADQLARDVVEPGSPGLAAIVEAFGPEMLGPNGALDRKRLGRTVFADKAARARLEGVTHPLIHAAMLERTRALAAAGEPLACYEAPLLVEVGLTEKLRPLVVVRADERAQIERAARRDGTSEEAARARIAAQLPLADKLAVADFVIDNTGALASTLEQADRVLDAICEKFGVAKARYPTPS